MNFRNSKMPCWANSWSSSFKSSSVCQARIYELVGVRGRREEEGYTPFLKALTTFRFVVSSSVWITFSLCLNLICSIRSARIVPNFCKEVILVFLRNLLQYTRCVCRIDGDTSEIHMRYIWDTSEIHMRHFWSHNRHPRLYLPITFIHFKAI